MKMMLPHLALFGVLLGLCFGFELQRLEHLEWFLANQTCSETLTGVLLTPTDAVLDKSLEIATPPTQNYWSSKTATVTDFIQFEGCFNSSVFTRREPLLPGQHPIAACFEICENTTRIGLMTKDMMNVDCVCPEQEDLASSRENVSNCYIPCPNDLMMNSCGNDQFMSVYNRQSKSGAPSLNGMAQCIALTTDDEGTVTLQYDDCQNTNDGYICEICDSGQCLQRVLHDMALTWQEAQEACQKRGGYLGNLGSAKAKTIWTGYKRWLLEDRYSVFGTYCLMCNYTNGTQMRDCRYINCSEELPSLCLKDSGKLPSRSWFEAENFCASSGSKLMSGEELYEKKVNESIYISHYYWANGVAIFTPYVRTIGCFDIHNISGIFSSIHTIQGPSHECVQICQNTNYFGLTNDSMTLQCFCMEHFKNLSQSNAIECTMPFTEEHDLCSGENGSLIVYEIDRHSVSYSNLESKMECMSLKKIQDFMHMESLDCLENATGYICEICDNEMKNCSQEFYVGEYNWYEAAMECRDKGGNLGNSMNYDIMVDGLYWVGGRRWLVEQNTTEGATPSDSLACQRCRINNGQLQCNYRQCSESLPGMCIAAEANYSLTTDTANQETTGALDVTTGSSRNHRNHTMYVHVTVTPTDSTESGKSKPQQENDDMNANVIAIVIVLLIIGGVVVMLVVTKLRKGEKVTSDVTDLISTKNGPVKFTDLRDSASRPASCHHMPVERQRSFSNPSYMDHDIDILAHNMEHDSHPDTVELDNERQDG